MALELPIAVYGNGDLYRELFNAIAATLNDSAYSYLIKLAIGLTGTWAIIRYSAERSLMPLAKWLVTYYIAFYIVFMPKVTVVIFDQINPGKAYTVDNVPLGLAAVANLTTAIGAGLTQLTEKTFSLPDDLKYGQTGMVMASRLVLASTQFQVTDPNFQKSLQSFVHQCIFYDLLLNQYSWSELLNSTNIWNFIQEHASKARAFAYYQPGNTQIITCQEGVATGQYLDHDWQNAIQSAAARYGARLFPDATDAKAQLLSYLPDSYQFLTNISDQATSLMQQNMLANALQNGILQMGAATNAPAALEAYSFTKAQQQKRLTNYTIGDMAAYWLPIMKNVLEATLYGAFIFVFLLILFPFGGSIFKNYVASLMWIQLWAPLYAILNLFMSFYAQKHSLGALSLGDGTSGLAVSTQTGLAQVNADVAGLAGYLSLSIPLLAAGIVKGLMSVFTQAAQYIAGVTQSAGASAAGDAVAGNLSLGNTNFSNHSAYNTSANHFDTNARVTAGGFTTQMPSGSSLSMMPDGSIVMNNQSAISSLGTSINLSDAIRYTASQQADNAYSAALSHANAYVNSLSSSLRRLHDISSHIGSSESNNDASSVTLSGGTTTALNQYEQLTERFAQDHNISKASASKWLLSAYLSGKAGASLDGGMSILGKGLKIGGGGDLGGKGEYDKSWTDEDRHLFSAAREFMQNNSYSQTVDTAIKGVQDHRYSTNSEQGQRLMEGINNSIDQAAQARQEMSSSFQQAESYRAVASYAEDNATSINSNVNQAFMNFLKEQGLSSGEIENMMVNHPATAQAYAQQFTQEQANHYLNTFQSHAGSSASRVESTFTQNNQTIPGNAAIEPQNKHFEKEVRQATEATGLNTANPVSQQPEKGAEVVIAASQYGVTTGQTTIKKGGIAQQVQTNKKLND